MFVKKIFPSAIKTLSDVIKYFENITFTMHIILCILTRFWN